MRTRKFPDEVFVTWFEENDKTLTPVVYECVADALNAEEQEIAVYTLLEVKRGKLVPQVR